MTDIVKWLQGFRVSSADSNFNASVVNKRIEEAADEIERLREALHQISLASQNSMDSKEGCGKIARKALGEKE